METTKCTCSAPAVACPSCLANRDRNGWPENWRERMGSEHEADEAVTK